MPTAAAPPTTAISGRSAAASRPPRRPSRPISSPRTIRGGHSSRPRPDNAIYDLADALKALQAHRFTPMLNDTSRGYFEERARQEGNSALGQAMRALARQSQRRRGGRRDRGQSARGRPDPHALRRDHAGGRPRRQRAAAERQGDGQLPDHARASSRRTSRPSCSSSPGPRSRSRPTPITSACRPRPRRFGPMC